MHVCMSTFFCKVPIIILLLAAGCASPRGPAPGTTATIEFTLPRYQPTCTYCGNTFVSPPLDWQTTGGSTVTDTNLAIIYTKSDYTIWFRCPACKRKFSASTYQTNAVPEVLFPLGSTSPARSTHPSLPPIPSRTIRRPGTYLPTIATEAQPVARVWEK